MGNKIELVPDLSHINDILIINQFSDLYNFITYFLIEIWAFEYIFDWTNFLVFLSYSYYHYSKYIIKNKYILNSENIFDDHLSILKNMDNKFPRKYLHIIPINRYFESQYIKYCEIYKNTNDIKGLESSFSKNCIKVNLKTVEISGKYPDKDPSEGFVNELFWIWHQLVVERVSVDDISRFYHDTIGSKVCSIIKKFGYPHAGWLF